VSRRAWLAGLAALAGFRVAIPLVALAGSGHDLPGVPAYDYAPLNGDSFGFYAATREFLASFERVGLPLLALTALALAAVAVALVRLWRRRPDLRWLALALGALALAVALVLPIREMEPSGAAVFGWPLVWALPMLPYRAAGLPLDPDIAFAFALPLQLAAVAATVVATAYIGLHATGRRSVGLAAAALFAGWPLLVRPLAGASAWENGQWNVDTGLHLYTEPVSTALVATAVALLLSPRLDPLRLTVAGLALSLSVAVKLSNALVAGALLVLVALRLDLRRALPLAAGLAALAPVALAYWRLGYPTLFEDPSSYSQRAWALDYGLRNWTDSLIWTPRTLLVLAPLALAGAYALRRTWALAVLAAVIAVNAVFYSFYDVTRHHPRFLYVALPALLVLEAAGAAKALDAARIRAKRMNPVRSS
jgi:hypothetical protein